MSSIVVSANVDAAAVDIGLDWDDVEHPPTVSRLDPDGVWRPVRAGNPVTLVDGTWNATDYEPALDVPIFYSASSLDADGVEQSIDADPVVVQSFGVAWMRHLATPSLSIRVHLTIAPDLTRASQSHAYAVLGRADPVAVVDVRQAATGTLSIYTGTLAERRALLALLADGSVLHLAMPASSDVSCYLLPGDLDETRVTGYGPAQERLWSLAFSVVERPR